MMKKNIIAIIPARGGSKGIPNKNIVNLAGKPLICWTIDAALKSQYIDDVFVSSDSDEILEVADKAGSNLIKRSDELSQDDTLTVPVLQNALEIIEEKNPTVHYDYLILLQATSPLRSSNHIDSAFEQLISTNSTSLISVVESNHSPLKSFSIENGFLKGLINNEYPFMRRQDLPQTYSANGAIYIVDLASFKKDGSLLTPRCTPFVMDQDSSVDIDTLDDLLIAEKLIAT